MGSLLGLWVKPLASLLLLIGSDVHGGAEEDGTGGVVTIAHHPMANLVASHLIVAEAHIGLVLTHLLPPN